MTPTDKSVRALRTYSIQRAAATTTAVEAALKDLRQRGQPINVQAVARHAGVTRATIYRRPELRERITAYRTTQAQPSRPATRDDHTSESSIIAGLRLQIVKRDELIKSLSADVQRLTQTIETLHGELDRHLR